MHGTFIDKTRLGLRNPEISVVLVFGYGIVVNGSQTDVTVAAHDAEESIGREILALDLSKLSLHGSLSFDYWLHFVAASRLTSQISFLYRVREAMMSQTRGR